MKFEEAFIFFGACLKRQAHFNMVVDCQSCDFYVEGLCATDGAECFFCEAQDRSHVKFAYFDSTFRNLDDFKREQVNPQK